MTIAGNPTNPYGIEEWKSKFPENFTSRWKKDDVEFSEFDQESAFQQFKKPSRIPLFRLQIEGQSYRLSKPIIVHIYREGEWIFAENERLVLTGTGSTEEEAIQDFKQHINYFLNYYRQLPTERLTGEALRLKEIYSKILLDL